MFRSLLILLVSLTIQFAEAQIPRMLSYQGVLTDSLGNPKPDGTYSFTFRLYDVPTAGSALWTEQKTLSVERGLFHTALGDQVLMGAGLTFDEPYWLGIQLASGPELTPRVPLTSVGQSLFSMLADTARYAMTAPMQAFVDSARSAMRADTARFALMAPQQGVVDSARISGTVPTGSITTLKIADSTITGTDVSRNAALTVATLNTSGNVGIGTSTPIHRLEVSSSVGETVLGIRNQTPGGRRWQLYSTGNLNGEGAGHFMVRDDSADVVRMFVAGTSGNVGIGTINPAHKLDVFGSINAAGRYYLNGSPIDVGQWTTTASGYDIYYSHIGNVGIGTGTPVSKLHLVGGTLTTALQASTTSLTTAKLFKGSGTATSTSTVIQAENYTSLGEAAWLRNSNSSNGSPVMKLHQHPSSTASFIDGMAWDGISGASRRFHITSAGTYVAGSDFAEAFAAEGGKDLYAPGDVLVVTSNGNKTVSKSSRRYDHAVVGIYSTRPGVLGADKDGETRLDPDDIPVAITGIVPTKVTCENGPIRPGDLLTTSSTSGHAMKATPRLIEGIEFYPPGSILGKALEGMESGSGVISVLVGVR